MRLVTPRNAATKIRKIALGLLAVLVVLGTAGWFSLDKETRGLLAALPTDRDLLIWSQPQRDAAFRALDRLPFLAKSRDVPAGDPCVNGQGIAPEGWLASSARASSSTRSAGSWSR